MNTYWNGSVQRTSTGVRTLRVPVSGTVLSLRDLDCFWDTKDGNKHSHSGAAEGDSGSLTGRPLLSSKRCQSDMKTNNLVSWLQSGGEQPSCLIESRSRSLKKMSTNLSFLFDLFLSGFLFPPGMHRHETPFSVLELITSGQTFLESIDSRAGSGSGDTGNWLKSVWEESIQIIPTELGFHDQAMLKQNGWSVFISNGDVIQ